MLMINRFSRLITLIAQYGIIILMVLYTADSWRVFRIRGAEEKDRVFLRQIRMIFAIHFLAFLSLFLKNMQSQLLLFYGAQVVYFGFVFVLYRNLYPRASRMLINNVCCLQMIGFVMITRLSIDQSIRQFEIAAAGSLFCLIVPLIVRKADFLMKLTDVYAIAGIGLLGAVLVRSRSVNGAKLTMTIRSFTFQPSEFIKILFVLAVAGLLSRKKNTKNLLIATAVAALHVLILVASTDLGSALIFFVTYLVMLFVSYRNPYLVLAGILAGAAASVAAYFLFSHVRVRVQIFLDPFTDYSNTGYQLAQSLFSLAAGGWFGTGLMNGSPGAIPYVEQDFMFSAVVEELGAVFGICLILVCLNSFIMIVNIAMLLKKDVLRLTALGLGCTYAVQCFLTIGGGMKLIPLTGVTLPLVSYGGSSLLSTSVMFAIVQGLYMRRSDEEIRDEERRFDQERGLDGEGAGIPEAVRTDPGSQSRD